MSGKYALILLAKLTEQDASDIVQEASEPDIIVEVPSDAILIGNESPESQFFVLKYRDKFTAAALIAYATAVIEYTQCLSNEKEAAELLEYANQIAEEARKSLALGDARHIPD